MRAIVWKNSIRLAVAKFGQGEEKQNSEMAGNEMIEMKKQKQHKYV
jgi:hypothetical protein